MWPAIPRDRPRPVASLAMDVVAVVWHFWIAPIMFLAAMGLVAATIVGYFIKVVRPRYPRD